MIPQDSMFINETIESTNEKLSPSVSLRCLYLHYRIAVYFSSFCFAVSFLSGACSIFVTLKAFLRATELQNVLTEEKG